MILGLEAAKSVAEKIEDTRALEGFLLRLSSVHKDLTRELMPEDVLPLLGRGKQTSIIIRPDNIISAVCSVYNLKTTQLKGAKRDSSLVGPRHICMFLLKEEVGLTYVEIGNLLGGRDHTTIMHGVNKIKTLKDTSPFLMEDLKKIKETIHEEL